MKVLEAALAVGIALAALLFGGWGAALVLLAQPWA